jgi:hypothetical protein
MADNSLRFVSESVMIRRAGAAGETYIRIFLSFNCSDCMLIACEHIFYKYNIASTTYIYNQQFGYT